MLLQNFNKIVPYYGANAKFENGSSSSGYNSATLLQNNYAGDQSSSRYMNNGSISNGVHFAVFVGKGDTEPTFTDYALASKATELTWLTASVTKDVNHVLYSVTSTFKNDTESPVVIKEIGFGWYGNNSNDGYGILIARSVLETPVTIGVGESYAFTYSIEL